MEQLGRLQPDVAGQFRRPNGERLQAGQYASVNLLHYPAKNVMVGGELLWGERENLNGDNAADNRVQFSAKFNF